MSGSESNDENGGGGKRRDNQGEELATKVISIQSKRFYLDVAGGGKKSRLFMSMHTSNVFKNHLDEFIEFINNNTDPANLEENAKSNLIHSATIVSDKRRYFLDLRENNRGKFLRITQSCQLAGTRFSIALPAQGVTQLRAALAELLDEYGEGYLDEPESVELPEARSLRADNKNFYFDPGNNDRGDYLKISEVKQSIGVRSSITISIKSLPQLIDVLNELRAKFDELRT